MIGESTPRGKDLSSISPYEVMIWGMPWLLEEGICFNPFSRPLWILEQAKQRGILYRMLLDGCQEDSGPFRGNMSLVAPIGCHECGSNSPSGVARIKTALVRKTGLLFDICYVPLSFSFFL